MRTDVASFLRIALMRAGGMGAGVPTAAPPLPRRRVRLFLGDPTADRPTLVALFVRFLFTAFFIVSAPPRSRA
jgi:hypothetical protein